MSTLSLPRRVIEQLLEEERLQFTACLTNACHSDATCELWNRELQRLDPLMRMVKAPEYLVIGMPLVPGHYHLIRDNETTFPSVTPVRGPNGEYREPDSALLEKLKSLDLQSARVTAQHALEARHAQEAAERDKLNRREARQGDLLERWNAVSRTQVSMNPDKPWAQNHAGEKRTRGEKRAERKRRP